MVISEPPPALVLDVCFAAGLRVQRAALRQLGILPPFRPLNPKTEIEPQIARMDTDDERVMETIFKPVGCILQSVKLREIRG